jgi:Zn finger protein HypA/HybF involved in hydrogenase expression
MSITVRCSNCNAVYETEATAAAVEQVGRCQECGERALTIEQDDEPGEPAPGD